MPDNPKTLGIIILIINLLVLGPTSWIVQEMRSDMIDAKEISRKRDNELRKQVDQVKNDLFKNFVDRDSYELDIYQIKDQINTIEGRQYDIHSHQ